MAQTRSKSTKSYNRNNSNAKSNNNNSNNYSNKSKGQKESLKIQRAENAAAFLRILLWPFKIIFMLFSWIVKIIILGFEKLIAIFSKTTNKIQKDVNDRKSERVKRYVAFKEVKSIHGSFSDFETNLSKKDSTIGIILGARGTGKSAIGLKLLENIHSLNDRKMYAMGFKTKDLPEWIESVTDVNQINNNSYVLIDEGGILFNSRQGFSDANQLLSKLLLIARHKDLSIIFISQNSSNLEINAIRQTDYLILKPSALLQLDFERKKIKEIYEEALIDFKKYKDVKGITYIYSDSFKGFVTNELPTFWTQNISKSFSGKVKE